TLPRAPHAEGLWKTCGRDVETLWTFCHGATIFWRSARNLRGLLHVDAPSMVLSLAPRITRARMLRRCRPQDNRDSPSFQPDHQWTAVPNRGVVRRPRQVARADRARAWRVARPHAVLR